MGRCRDCRHWITYPHDTMGDESRNYGDCGLADTEGEGSLILGIHVSDTNQNGDSIPASLITGYDFGCVLFEAKP